MPVSSATPADVGPLVVKPKVAWQMLSCSNTRGYELLAAGALDSFATAVRAKSRSSRYAATSRKGSRLRKARPRNRSRLAVNAADRANHPLWWWSDHARRKRSEARDGGSRTRASENRSSRAARSHPKFHSLLHHSNSRRTSATVAAWNPLCLGQHIIRCAVRTA